MSPLDAAVAASFAGTLDLDEQPIPVTVTFSDTTVRFDVGPEEIGTWAYDRIEFSEQDDGRFLVRADEDQVVFTPDDVEAFRSRAAGEPTGPGDGVSFEIPPRPTYPEPAGTTVEAGDEIGSGSTRGETGAAPMPDDGAGDAPATLDDLRPDDPEDDGRPLIDPADRTDELFAAGYNAPEGADDPGDHLRLPTRRTGNGHLLHSEQSSPPIGAGDPAPGMPRSEGPAIADSTGPDLDGDRHGGDDAAEAVGRHAAVTSDGARDSHATMRSADEPDSESPPETGSDGDGPSPRSRFGKRRGKRLAEAKLATAVPPSDRARSGEPGGDDEPADAPVEEESSSGSDAAGDGAASGRRSIVKRLAGVEPSSDAENLRQWAIVAGGGLVLVAMLTAIVWAISNVVMSEDGTTATTAADSPPVAAPATSAPAPVQTSTTAAEVASDGSGAAAGEFVADWNSLASRYAYSLVIGESFESLPVSTALTPSLQLGYDTQRVLTLSAAPQSDGTDRDILVAMGLAIAWADPAVSPEGRRDILSSLGVDIDDPSVADMGGELTRGGAVYSLEVVEGIVRFRVAPAA